MFKFIRRALCNHSFSWSERRRGDVCVHCGRFRAELGGPTAEAESRGH